MTREERKKLRKKKRRRKTNKRLYRRVYRKKEEMNSIIYVLLQTITLLIEFIRRFLVFFLWFFLTLGIIGGIGGGIIFSKFYPIYEEYQKEAIEIVNNSSKEDFKIFESSVIYDNEGNVLATLFENADMEYLDYDEIPKEVINAFIAIEDRTFWENPGIDFKGLTRVLYRFILTKGEEKHGASTITQQLARNMFLSHEVSIERKAKEILIALELTKKYSKEEIMEYYCNNICFANGIYGINGAAKAYFNKDISECNLKEIAYLCAIPNSPEHYNPYKYPERAVERSKKILNDMFECGFIDEQEYKESKKEEIIIEKPIYEFNNFATTFAIDCAIKELMKIDGFKFRYNFKDMKDYREYKSSYNDFYEETKHQLYTNGYMIYTSLDMDIFNKVQGVLDNVLYFDEAVNEITNTYELQGALTVIDNLTGKVVALVGGRSQDTNYVYSLNRAYQSPRQPGSSIKPIAVYAPAFENDFKPNSIVQDISVTAAKEKGVDVQALIGKPYVLRTAVEWSKNGTAWQVFDKITPKVGLSYLEKMKFSHLCPDDYFNSSALGGLTYGTTTVEMASAYSTLANHGEWKDPTCITKIYDKNYKNIYIEDEPVKVYTSKAADDMVDVLKGVLTRGTGAKLKWSKLSKIEAFGKTGTTNDNKDGWFCGSTPYYSIAVWVGYDSPKSVNNLSGSSYPGTIWAECMSSITSELDELKFERDEEDESYTNMPHSDRWYSYMPDRDASEVLSGSYTVANYRDDRLIGEDVQIIIDAIGRLDPINPEFQVDLENLFARGNLTCDTIYSTKYENEMRIKLQEMYQSKVVLIPIMPIPEMTIPEIPIQ